jgi:hypothetical protein
MRFGRIASILVLMALLVVPVAAEEDAATIEVAPFFDGAYKAGQWLPVRVTVANNGPDREAIVRLGGRSGASFDTPIDLPSGARKSLVMYVRPDSLARTLQARVVDGEQELATAAARVKQPADQGRDPPIGGCRRAVAGRRSFLILDYPA